MKHFIKTGLPFVLVVAFTPPCFGAASLCLTLANCTSQISSNLMGYKYCCPTGLYGSGTTYTCPTGWTNNGGTCERASVSGTDTKGAYTTTYGTCDATSSTSSYPCYELSASGTTAEGLACITSTTTGDL